MRALVKKIKGFTIFEVLIVLVLVGIISGIAYPNFSQWRKDRAVKNAAEKIRGIFLSTNAQVQRGLYGFAQVYISPNVDDVDADDPEILSFRFVSRGMKQKSIPQRKSDNQDIWNDSAERCLMESGGQEGDFWDDDGEVSNKPEVGAFTLEDVSLNITDAAAVCFSKDGSLYGTNGGFINDNAFFGSSVWAIYICDGKNGECIIDEDEDEDGETESVTYALSWSRFGNVTLYKYNSGDKEFVVQ